jgi:hypothetical protein
VTDPRQNDALTRVKAAARADFNWYSRKFLRVVNNQVYVPFELRPAQSRLETILTAQRAEGRPMRAIILKARKMGFSTFAQGLMIQRATLRANHNCLTVAQDNKTAHELFGIGEAMYGYLPNDPDLAWCKPPITHTRRGRELHFGEASRDARSRGDRGLNSKILVDTANEFDAGRGFTFHTLHLSEVAFWADIQRKLTSLLNTVPQDDPDTLILVESTPNGFNYFQKMWERAEKGDSEYAPFFAAWFEDTRYARPFVGDQDRGEFEAIVGTGPFGGDEPDLRAQGLTLEQLHWRRWAIENLTHGDLDTFRQEYPGNPEEAFIGTGRTVFAANRVRQIIRDTIELDKGAEELWLEASERKTRHRMFGTIDVPTKLRERERTGQERGDHFWRCWTRPDEGSGHFIVSMDPAKGRENTAREADYTTIQVIDHKTREQCAEWRSHIDPIPAAEQMYLALMWFSVNGNLPLAVIDCSGGYGDAIARRVWKEYGWRNMYFRNPVDPRRREVQTDLVGFMFDRGNKPQVEALAQEIIRSEQHGIRSRLLADEIQRYIRDKSGKTGAEDGAHDDLLTAWMVAQFVAGLKPPREKRAGGVISTSSYRHVVVQ